MSDICFKYSIASYQVCKEPDFLTGVFEYWSSVLEPDGLGTKFPTFFISFYNGEALRENLEMLKNEINLMKPLLKGTRVNMDAVLNLPYFISCLKKEPSQIKCFVKDANNAYDAFKGFLEHNLIVEIENAIDGAIDFNSSLKIVSYPD